MDGIAPASLPPSIKGKRKRIKRVGRGGSNSVKFVCTSSSSSNDSTVEIGLIISLFILTLYLYGFFESVWALPEVHTSLNLANHLGRNLNLAKDEWTTDEVDHLHPSIKSDPSRKKKKKKKTAQTDIVLPETQWPVSIRFEDNNFEDIVHPGDMKTKMSVPKFWAAPVHHGELMSRETAMKVGSCNEPDPKTGNRARGDDCPEDERTIYFAIASYRDFQCRFTVESAFSRAKNPYRIRVGVVDQIVDGEDPACNEPVEPCDKKPDQALCKFRDRVDVYEMEAGLSVGPVFARHIGHRLYRGEYYYTQSDAHVTWTQNWDEDIIKQMEATKNEMAVLTTYLTDVQGSIDANGHSLRNTRPIMCNTHYEGGGNQATHLRHGSQPEREPSIHGMPQMQPYWAAGFSFSRGHFVVNVPYDILQPMIFQGEEMSIGIRGFTVGYDMYSPERSVCFHHYAVGNNARTRNKVPHFWEHARNYKGIGIKAMDRLLGIVHMNPEVDPTTWDHTEEELYGLGGVRTPEKFYETFGIDVVRKETEDHLCMFVDRGGMHRQFQPLVRSDGMGVDYDKITYKFVDPKKKD